MKTKEIIYIGIGLSIITVLSLFMSGYRSPAIDDESSAYISVAYAKENPSLYKNDFYVQALKDVPVDSMMWTLNKISTDEFTIHYDNWGEVLLFGLESDKDDLFVIPVFSGKYDYSTFRMLSKKAIFLDWKGTGAAVYVEGMVPEIRKRFIDYCKTDFTTTKDRKGFVETCKFNYNYNMHEEDFKVLNSKYGADYLIENKIETPRTLNLPVAWENEEFIIYWLGNSTKYPPLHALPEEL